MPRFRNLVIFVVMTTDRQTDYFNPVHARKVIMHINLSLKFNSTVIVLLHMTQ